MLDYPCLAALAAVVREGSFERAARALSVTSSAVSQRVKLLEDRLGSVLVVRGRPCVPTETGRLLCRHIEQVAMLEQDLRSALPKLARGLPEGGSPAIRLAVNDDSLGTWFVGAMAKFLQSEALLLDIVLDDQENTLEWLRSGDVLAAVTVTARAIQGCNSVPLGRLRYVAAASPTFVRRYFAAGVNAESVASAPMINFNRKDRLQSQWVRRVCGRHVDTPVHWLPSTLGSIEAATAGIGWGMNPAVLLGPHLRAGTLVELVPRRMLSVPLYWQYARLQAPALSRLTRAIVAEARKNLLG
jgi:LysR family transcriptional regulator (chromosome initiation inhibitor)